MTLIPLCKFVRYYGFVWVALLLEAFKALNDSFIIGCTCSTNVDRLLEPYIFIALVLYEMAEQSTSVLLWITTIIYRIIIVKMHLQFLTWTKKLHQFRQLKKNIHL